jgi:glycosyltransferase involved in cell wall biosynthesis
MKRVLMTGDTVGGVWTYTMELAAALGQQGVEVVLATMGGTPVVEQRLEAHQIPLLTLLASDFKLEWMNNPWPDIEISGRWLLDLEKHYAPDVIHLNSFGHGALSWHRPVVLTAHSCILSWWRAVKGEPAPSSWNRYRDLVRASMHSVDLVTAPSRAMADSVVEHYGAANCAVIPNGRSAARFRPAAKEAIVLAAGRLWDEAKNIVSLARIAERLPWPVYVAGECLHPEGRAARFQGCTILGRLAADVMARWYARAAIYALPARYEPFGLSVLEAALSGCALVLGDIPSLRENWDEAALFVDPSDPAALKEAIVRLIDDRTYRGEIAAAAMRRARQFTPHRMAESYLATYRQLAARRAHCAS